MAHNLPIDPREARAHRGRWVAVRRGRVVASASSLKALLESTLVLRTDTRWKVPRR